MNRFGSFLFRSPVRVPLFATSPSLFPLRNPMTKKIFMDKMINCTRSVISLKFVADPKKFARNFTSSGNSSLSVLHTSVGSNLRAKCFTGLSILAGTLYLCPTHACSVDGSSMMEESQHWESTNPLDFLKEDLYNFWLVAERFQMPAVLLFMVLYGWRNPITLVINIVLLLSCTRPRPYSVYIFIEKLRERAMSQDPRMSKSKLPYARKVDVKDYKLLCTAKVELMGWELNLIGVLGSWWILQSTKI